MVKYNKHFTIIVSYILLLTSEYTKFKWFCFHSGKALTAGNTKPRASADFTQDFSASKNNVCVRLLNPTSGTVFFYI